MRYKLIKGIHYCIDPMVKKSSILQIFGHSMSEGMPDVWGSFTKVNFCRWNNKIL